VLKCADMNMKCSKKQIGGLVALKVLPKLHSFSGDVKVKNWER